MRSLICLLYSGLGLLLYRHRATTSVVWLDSDLVVFVGPAVLAFVALFVTARRSPTRASGRHVHTAFGAIGAVALSFFGYMLIAVNLYGN